jgi:hypothetical protein
MRKLITTIAAALALAGVGLATHHATSDAPDDAAIVFDVGNHFTGPEPP